jgi:O-Antigen ligase
VTFGLLASGLLLAFPNIGFLLTAAVVPLERVGRLTNDATDYSISLMRLLGLATLGTFLLHTLIARRRLVVARPLVFYGAYLVIGVLTLAHTSDRTYGIRAVGAMLGNLLFFFLVINMVRTAAQARTAVICWLVTTAVIGTFTIYQWHNPAAVIDEDPFNSTGERSAEDRFSTVLSDTSEYQVLDKTPRALGSTSHPAVYGINLILALPFFAYLYRTARSAWVRPIVALAAAVTAYNVVLSNTRAALITLGLCVGLIVWTGIIQLTPRLIAAACAAILLIGPLVPSAIYERIFDLSNYSTGRSDTMQARLTYWREGLQMFSEHWLLGIGIGNQSELPRRLSARMRMPENSTVHNEYLQSLLETGIVGFPLLVVFVLMLNTRCRDGAHACRMHGDRETALIFTAARVALLSTLFYGTQVDVLHFPLKGWWLAMGIAVALTERRVWISRTFVHERTAS